MTLDPAIGGSRRYQSYLLRLWTVETAGRVVWRASLQSTRTGEWLGFADLAAVAHYLAEQTENAPTPPPTPAR